MRRFLQCVWCLGTALKKVAPLCVIVAIIALGITLWCEGKFLPGERPMAYDVSGMVICFGLLVAGASFILGTILRILAENEYDAWREKIADRAYCRAMNKGKYDLACWAHDKIR